MRSLRVVVLIALMLLPAVAPAEPRAGPSFGLETVTMAGAIFAGLSRDGDDLLVTDLAGGRLFRRHPDGTLIAFGPVLPHGAT